MNMAIQKQTTNASDHLLAGFCLTFKQSSSRLLAK